MTKKTRIAGHAEYAFAQRELAVTQREAMATLAELKAAREKLQATQEQSGNAALLIAIGKDIAAIEQRYAKLKRALDKLGQQTDVARERALGGESGFEQLSIAHPLLLLPVRLETRFAWMNGNTIGFMQDPAREAVLLVRIYPDEIHEDAHEPELTQMEAHWVAEFQKKLLLARDNPPIRDAWAELISRAGPTRAAWLGQVAIDAAKPGKRPSVFSRAPVAKLLPDRWVVFVSLPNGTTLSAMSSPVREPLEIGLSQIGAAWMTDFEAALKTGMALIVRGLPANANEIRRLTVVGARSTLDPAQAQRELEQLFAAHRYTRGLSFVAPGTATNSSSSERAGFSTRPELAEIIAIEERRFRVGGYSEPLCRRGDQSDGAAFAHALGVGPASFAFVARADTTDQVDAYMMRSVLTAATQRPLMRLLGGILDLTALANVFEFAVERVSALGHVPTLRIGSQPYAVLPVMLTQGKTVRFPDQSFFAWLLPVLTRLRAVWESAAANLDWVGKAGSAGVGPGRALVKILQRDGIASRIAFRPLLGPQTSGQIDGSLAAAARASLQAQRQAAAAAIDALGAANSSNSALLQTLHFSSAAPLTDPVVQADDLTPGSVQRASEYLELVAALRPDQLLQHGDDDQERPRALLYAIARLAMLEQADAHAREVLIAAGADAREWDTEEVPSIYRNALGTPLRRLQAPDPADPLASIAFHLSELGRDAGVLGTLRQTLRWLKTRPPELLDVQLRANLGLFSNRLDAWYTALAFEQLLQIRNGVNTQTGINIGAYGVLENIVRAPRQAVPGNTGLFTNPVNGGYVHAPSVNQGVAAAVLRSVHLAHSAAGHGTAFAVDLSSERVRHALMLLEGIRAGQPLAALLGYRIECALSAERLQRFIAPLRSVAPLIANTLTPSTQPAESVAANNVVDGLALLERAGYDGQQAASVNTLWQRYASLGALPGGKECTALQRVLTAAQDAVDAVSDLVLAESVYQAVQGNPARAGAAADSTSGAPVPPADMTIVKTPRTGIGATHRLLLMLGDSGGASAVTSNWAATPRAVCEPRLEAWCSAVLPNPAQIRLRAVFRRSDGRVVATLEDLLLGELMQVAGRRSANHLLFSALDLVALADPQETPQRSGFEVRLAALVEMVRPSAAGDAELELSYERQTAWSAAEFSIVDTLEVASQLRNVIGHARALAPQDLAMPGKTPSIGIDSNDHAARAQKGADALLGVQQALAPLTACNEAAALREALFSADALGVAGAAPTSLRDASDKKAQGQLVKQLQAQAKAVSAELARRIQRLNAASVDDAAGRLKAVFGEGCLSLPLLVGAAPVSQLFDKPPAGASAAAARTWLARAARAREGARLLDGALSCADVCAEVAVRVRRNMLVPRLSVAQLGGAPSEAWIALPLVGGATPPGGRVSIVAASVGPLPTQNIAGLFIDEWVEVIPSNEEITSVAFHYDAPSSAPPQTMLLGVPHPGLKHWTADVAAELVAEALALSKIRLVDMDDIPSLGQLFPAFVTAESTEGEVNALNVDQLTGSGGT